MIANIAQRTFYLAMVPYIIMLNPPLPGHQYLACMVTLFITPGMTAWFYTVCFITLFYRQLQICQIRFNEDRLRDMIDEKQSDVIVMDFTKAFNKVSHARRLHKLQGFF